MPLEVETSHGKLAAEAIPVQIVCYLPVEVAESVEFQESDAEGAFIVEFFIALCWCMVSCSLLHNFPALQLDSSARIGSMRNRICCV